MYNIFEFEKKPSNYVLFKKGLTKNTEKKVLRDKKDAGCKPHV